MKKFIIITLTLILSFCFAGCTKNESNISSKECFDKILNDEQSFYSTDKKTDILLSDYNLKALSYSYVDMDNDNIDELVIELETFDILILRIDGESVIGFEFGHRAMASIFTDGSFLWNQNSGNTYGCSRLEFTGKTYKTTELWRVENDDAGSTTYYIDGKTATKEQLDSLSEPTSINWSSLSTSLDNTSIDYNQISNDEELLKVLRNEKTFIDSNENHVYLKDYKPICEFPEGSDYYEKDAVFVPKDYAFVDLDNDSKNELVVSESPNADTYLILRKEKKQIYGLCLYVRWFQSLKTDGTFLSSSGAFLHTYNTIKFNKNSYDFSTIATFDFVADTDKIASNKYGYEPNYEKSIFEIDGKKVSFEQILEFADEWNKRTDVAWKTYVIANDLSDKELVEIVAQNLGVPKDINVTYEISQKYYWDAGERYFKNVSFYENEQLVATASVDPVTGELIKNIALYQN